MLEKPEKTAVDTPFGKPSSEIVTGNFEGTKVGFLFRHGPKHTIPPHKINFRANMHALKELGAKRIIGIAAVGSLKDDIHPGDMVFPDQLIDWGKEVTTYFDGPEVRHTPFADPFCPEMREALIKNAKRLGIKFHEKGTYLRVSGPRFSTRAESRMFRQFADVIGMTCIPEAILARELGICYAAIAAVTDYDVYKEKAVEISDVIRTMKSNSEKIERLLGAVIPSMPEKKGCDCGEAPEKAKM
ncbi:MAG: MTAP family purine nucleoside phosphorylase [Candidatus Aenigmarchaeota archaeon]|nr:MTAP family purine nucleoside phosphorylase [Candidatus Aenigmarchaeota archaeon]